jgi:anti-sigma B factor antagonist
VARNLRRRHYVAGTGHYDHDVTHGQAEPTFDISTTDEGRAVVVTVHGEIDLSTHDQLAAALHRAVAPPARQIVVDLSDVGFLDSSGIRTLVIGWRQAEGQGMSFALRKPRPVVLKVLRLTGVDQALAILP